MTNKVHERFSTLQLAIPAATTINSGDLVIFGRGSHAIVGVAAEAQTNVAPIPSYDSGSGYVTVDFEGVFNLTVKGQTQSSPSAGAALNPGDAVYADGGTYDATTGLTLGSTVDGDSNGTFVGITLDAVSAGASKTVRVLLKNAPC